MKTSVALLCATLLAGCATVEESTLYHGVTVEPAETPVATLEIQNTCWLVLGCLPLGSGDPLLPNECACRLFVNTATLENNIRMLEKAARDRGAARLANLTSHTSDESKFFILVTRRAIRTSACLIK